MAKYLITVRSSGSLAGSQATPAPTDYLVDWVEDAAAPESDGLDRWQIDLQIAGVITEWAKSPAFDAFWEFLLASLRAVEVRPRGALSLKSHSDPRRVGIRVAYLGDHEIARAKEGLRQRIEAAFDPKTKRLKSDVELTI